MIKIDAPRAPVSLLDHHSYICDLLYLEGAILSLYRDSKQNWLYLWCDTDGQLAERWLVFAVSRQQLIAYFERRDSLSDLVAESVKVLLLDKVSKENFDEHGVSQGFTMHRSLKKIDHLSLIGDYMPEPDSLFEEELAPDISLAREITPTAFDVPIDGRWFVSDLDRFSKVYSQLYAFFYCAKPRFVNNIGERIRRYLSSPWTGGYSRINLFDALQASVPSLHDLEIKHIQYASPGEIRIEALESVGSSIAESVKNFLSLQAEVSLAEKRINTVLSLHQLKKSNLSELSDEKLPLRPNDLDFLEEQRALIAKAMGIEDELQRLSAYSPNIVVSTKVLMAVVARVRRVAEFEHTGLLDLNRAPKRATLAMDAATQSN